MPCSGLISPTLSEAPKSRCLGIKSPFHQLFPKLFGKRSNREPTLFLASPDAVTTGLIVLGVANFGLAVFDGNKVRHSKNQSLQPLFRGQKLNSKIRGKLDFSCFTDCLFRRLRRDQAAISELN